MVCRGCWIFQLSSNRHEKVDTTVAFPRGQDGSPLATMTHSQQLRWESGGIAELVNQPCLHFSNTTETGPEAGHAVPRKGSSPGRSGAGSSPQVEGSEGRQGWGSTGPISEGNTGPVPEDPRAPLNGRRGLDGHEGVSEKSVCTSSVGLKANALVLLGPGAQTWGLRWGSLSAPEVAGNSLLHLHPLANPTGQQRQLDFSWGPCCPDRRGRSAAKGMRRWQPGQLRWRRRLSHLTLTRYTHAHPHQPIFGERNQKRL